eukprot:sb/3463566/
MTIDTCIPEGLSETDAVEYNIARIQSLTHCHELLGESYICSLSGGLFLSYIIECCVRYKKQGIYIEDCTNMVEQAVFCYIGHPGAGSKRSKKNRADHAATPVPLTLENAKSIYEFYLPSEMFSPMESGKHFSADVLELMLQIVNLFTNDVSRSETFVKIKLSIETYQKQVTGSNSEKVINYEPYSEEPALVHFKDIYYLCGDYIWKYGDFLKAIDWFICDLAVNPDRLESWLSMGLCWLSVAEDQFNQSQSDLKVVIESIAPKAVFCFDHYMSNTVTPFEVAAEYAIFLYTIASVYNQVAGALSENAAVIKEIDMKRLTLFLKSKEILEKGAEPDGPKKWIKHFMLGKIAEKFNYKSLVWLENYMMSIENLSGYHSALTKRINTSSPADFSMECFELRTREHPELLQEVDVKDKMVESMRALYTLMGLDDAADKGLEELCVRVLEEAFSRWPEHYKIRNALCKIYHERSTESQEAFQNAKNLMLQDTSNSGGMFLFSRKHLFFGIWRIPIDTVDRPGGFFRHMRKSLSLIISSLAHCKDISNLISCLRTWSRQQTN